MQYQKMPSRKGQIEISDLRQAKKCTAPDVRIIQQNKKLRFLPKGFANINHIPRVEFDLSYNKTLKPDFIFNSLLDYPNLRGLGMIKNEMKILPESIGQLNLLEVLELWSNGLKTLPDSFCKLKQLEYLNLRNNSLTSIPIYFINFKKLKTLNLRFNKIKVVPEHLFKLENLEELDLGSCGLKDLPKGIGQLKKLKSLNLSKNNLKNLPTELGQLKELEHIDLKGNKHLDWDQAFSVLKDLPKITRLDLSEEGLTQLPESIGLMPQLQELFIRDNQITCLPTSIIKLTQLERFEYNNNPWNLKQFFPVLGKLPSTTALFSFQTLGFEHKDDITELPLDGKDFPYVTEIDFSELENLLHLPEGLGQFSKLKRLFISNCGIKSLPNLSGLTNLKEISIYGNAKLKEIPDSFYQIPQLQKLDFKLNGVGLDFTKVKQLKKLRILSIPDYEAETFEKCKPLTQVEQLDFAGFRRGYTYQKYIEKGVVPKTIVDLIEGKTTLTSLPSSFYQLKHLKRIFLPTMKDLDLASALLQLRNFENLEEIMIDYRFDTKTFVEALIPFPNLKKVTGTLHYPLTNEIEQLKHVEELKLSLIGYNTQSKFQLPEAFLHFPSDNIKFTDYHLRGKYEELFEIKTEINTWDIEMERKKIFFLLWQRRFEDIQAIIESPFDEAQQLKDKVIWVAGRPGHGTLEKLRSTLKSRGATICKKWSDQVNLVLLTPNFKDSDWETIKGKTHFDFMLEDQLKEILLKENTPYLMEKGNEDLNQQITQLLKAKGDNQIELVLQLIEGGGVDQTTLSYLAAIHLFQPDTTIRKKARTLFRKYASSSLQAHIKSIWKNNFRDKDIYAWRKILEAPSLDWGAFILAWKMIQWFEKKYHLNTSAYHFHHFSQFSLNNLPKRLELCESIKEWDWITGLTIGSQEVIDVDKLAEYLSATPLKKLRLITPIEEFPYALWNIPHLEDLHIDSQKIIKPSDSKKLIPNEKIKTFSMSNVANDTIPLIQLMPKLESLNLSDGTISDFDFIGEFTQLTHLSIIRCQMGKIPKSFKQLSQLKVLNLGSNPITEAEIDFSAFAKLEKLDLSECQLTQIPDTFKNCTSLDQVSLNKNKLTSLPVSLFNIPSPKAGHRLTIGVRQNQIRTIGDMNSSSKEHTPPTESPMEIHLDCSDNQMETIPTYLSKTSTLKSLTSYGNPITSIPEELCYQALTLSLRRANLQSIPLSIFHPTKKEWDIDIENPDIVLPPIADIPKHNNYLRFTYRGKKKNILQFIKKAEEQFDYNAS